MTAQPITTFNVHIDTDTSDGEQFDKTIDQLQVNQNTGAVTAIKDGKKTYVTNLNDDTPIMDIYVDLNGDGKADNWMLLSAPDGTLKLNGLADLHPGQSTVPIGKLQQEDINGDGIDDERLSTNPNYPSPIESVYFMQHGSMPHWAKQVVLISPTSEQ